MYLDWLWLGFRLGSDWLQFGLLNPGYRFILDDLRLDCSGLLRLLLDEELLNERCLVIYHFFLEVFHLRGHYLQLALILVMLLLEFLDLIFFLFDLVFVVKILCAHECCLCFNESF